MYAQLIHVNISHSFIKAKNHLPQAFVIEQQPQDFVFVLVPLLLHSGQRAPNHSTKYNKPNQTNW